MDILLPATHAIYRIERWVTQLGSSLAELVWPTRCVGCEKHGVLLCHSCHERLPYIDQNLACTRCGAPMGRLSCTECDPIYEPVAFAFSAASCAMEYDKLAKRLMLAYKDGGERRLAPFIAHAIACSLPDEWRRWADVLTWIPADSHALRIRGFDHMALLAVEVATQLGIGLDAFLEKLSSADQRQLNRKQRQKNVGAAFRLREQWQRECNNRREEGRLRGLHAEKGEVQSALKPGLLNKNIVLLDDVFTTGATLDAAARLLLGAGAQEIRVATLCRVW